MVCVMLNSIALGCPKNVCADRGSENPKIAFLRCNGTDGHSAENSFHYGRSVNKQVHTSILYSSSSITKF